MMGVLHISNIPNYLIVSQEQHHKSDKFNLRLKSVSAHLHVILKLLEIF